MTLATIRGNDEALAKKRAFLRTAMRVKATIPRIDDNVNSAITWVKAAQKLCAIYNLRIKVPFKVLRTLISRPQPILQN